MTDKAKAEKDKAKYAALVVDMTQEEAVFAFKLY